MKGLMTARWLNQLGSIQHTINDRCKWAVWHLSSSPALATVAAGDNEDAANVAVMVAPVVACGAECHLDEVVTAIVRKVIWTKQQF